MSPTHKHKDPKRVGRGGKRGTYSGKGIKGQKARAGRRIRPALRDLLKKIPKRRGYRFHSLQVKPSVINVGDLENRFVAGEVVSPATLRAKKLFVPKKGQPFGVKILGDGAITKALTVESIPLSQSARAKIEAAGGKVAKNVS